MDRDVKLKITVEGELTRECSFDRVKKLSGTDVALNVVLKGLYACVFDRIEPIPDFAFEVHRETVTLAIRASYIATQNTVSLFEPVEKRIQHFAFVEIH